MGLFRFRIPTLYLLLTYGKAFGFWNEMNLCASNETKNLPQLFTKFPSSSSSFAKVILKELSLFRFVQFPEADYTLDDSFWNEESPVGEEVN